MIYEPVNHDAPVRQGDVFRSIPRIDSDTAALGLVREDETEAVISWRDLLEEGMPADGAAIVAPIQSVLAIVVTQDCDCARGEFVTLCQIIPYPGAGGKPPGGPKQWASLITRQSRENLRYFYLPESSDFGLKTRSAVDFRISIRLRRENLESLIDHRLGRLTRVAYEHFRETMAQYFRRFPYNEWYPLTKDEFVAYSNGSPEKIAPYPWQNSQSATPTGNDASLPSASDQSSTTASD